MPKFSMIMILAGIILIFAALAVPTFSIIYVNQNTQSYTVNVPLTASMPSSTSPSSPTNFPLNGYELIQAEWGGTITQISDVDASGSGIVSVQIMDSAGYAATETMKNSWKLYYQENYLTHTYTEYFFAQASFNFTNPYPTQSIVYTFNFSGSATYNGGTFKYDAATVYGEFPLQSVQNLGHFYIQVGNTTPEKISNNAATLYYNISGTSTTFQIWYVEDNGTTTPFTSAYYTYQFGTTQGQVTLTTQTTLDGYTAYTSTPITIPVPTKLYIQGYVLANGAQGSPYELMSIFGNWGNSTVVTQHITENQEITIGIGAFILIVGVALFVTKRW